MGIAFILSLSLFATAVSCKKEANLIEPDQPGNEQPIPSTPTGSAGAVTPVATPEGTIVTATVGPAGGTIESADKRIRVAVPAGTLTASQTISVQPLNENHCPWETHETLNKNTHVKIPYDHDLFIAAYD